MVETGFVLGVLRFSQLLCQIRKDERSPLSSLFHGAHKGNDIACRGVTACDCAPSAPKLVESQRI